MNEDYLDTLMASLTSFELPRLGCSTSVSAGQGVTVDYPGIIRPRRHIHAMHLARVGSGKVIHNEQPVA